MKQKVRKKKKHNNHNSTLHIPEKLLINIRGLINIQKISIFIIKFKDPLKIKNAIMTRLSVNVKYKNMVITRSFFPQHLNKSSSSMYNFVETEINKEGRKPKTKLKLIGILIFYNKNYIKG